MRNHFTGRSAGVFLALILAMAVVFCASAPARAYKSVAEELLEILKAKGQISDAEYDLLMKKALEEKKAWQAAVERKQAPANQALKEEIKSELKAEIQEETAEAVKKEVAANEKPEDFRVYFKNGLKMETRDKNFTMGIGGRVKMDVGAWSGDSKMNKQFSGYPGAGSKIAMARVNVHGTAWKNFLYKGEVEFSNGKAAIKDMFVGAKGLPYLGKIRVGNMKEPYGMETYMASRDTLLMENSLSNAFSPAHNLGVMAEHAVFDKRMTWALGAFMEDTNTNAFGNYDNLHLDARISGLPWWEEGGGGYLHLAAAYSHQFRGGDKDPLSYAARSGISMAPTIVSTGDMDAQGVDLLAAEAILSYDSMFLLGQYTHSFVNLKGSKNASFGGWFAQAGWFPTGEYLPYNRGTGVIGRVIPKQNFSFTEAGWGAFLLTIRGASLDLNDSSAGIRGGKAYDATLGLTWYLNPMFRVLANYTHSWLEDRHDSSININNGQADAVGMRVQLDF